MKRCVCIVSIAMMVLAVGCGSVVDASWMDEFSFSGTFESIYWDHDPDDWTLGENDIYEGPYSSFENQLLLHVDWRNWYAEIKLRNMQYQDGIHYDYRSREHETDLEVFKFKAGFRTEHFTVTGGDFYRSLGRGIVLYVQEDKDLNLDRTIRGGDIVFTADWFEAGIFGGEVTWYEFVDNVSLLTYSEREINDELFGGHLGFRIMDGVTLTANYVTGTLYDYVRSEEVGEDFQVAGAAANVSGLFGGHLDLYGEFGRLMWDADDPYGVETEDGEAMYASATGYIGDLTVLVEYKDYDYWDYRYGRPPTADREDEASEIDDIKGLRVKLDYYFPSSDTLVYFSYGAFDNQGHPDALGNIFRNTINHYYGGIEQTWQNMYVHLTWGYKDFEDIDEVHRRGTADLVYSFFDRHSLNLYYEYKYTGVPGSDKDEHKTYLTYSFSPYVSVTAHYNRHVYDYDLLNDSEDEWWAGELSVTPIDTLTVNVLFGGLPTGLLCSGGQCRIVPEFEGLQASVTYTF